MVSSSSAVSAGLVSSTSSDSTSMTFAVAEGVRICRFGNFRVADGSVGDFFNGFFNHDIRLDRGGSFIFNKTADNQQDDDYQNNVKQFFIVNVLYELLFIIYPTFSSGNCQQLLVFILRQNDCLRCSGVTRNRRI